MFDVGRLLSDACGRVLTCAVILRFAQADTVCCSPRQRNLAHGSGLCDRMQGKLADRRPCGERCLKHTLRNRKLVSGKLEPWPANPRRACAYLLLNPLDELHELRDRIHAEQRQEPLVQRERLLVATRTGKLK